MKDEHLPSKFNSHRFYIFLKKFAFVYKKNSHRGKSHGVNAFIYSLRLCFKKAAHTFY